MKYMSNFTKNILMGINFEDIKLKRLENFCYLHDKLEKYNMLDIKQNGTYMYPFMCNNSEEIRKGLIQEKIYVPIFWSNIFEECNKSSIEYQYAQNIIPLPIDQRYNLEDMKIIVRKLLELIKD